ncbi:MAG: hypothetical protein U0M66_06765 [Bacilli bacterium]|nr:hypothetical protein [Bacilli bacterium]
MHQSELMENRKGFLIKVAFFIALLMFIGFMYLESNMVLDAVYFVVVLALFIKFLVVKLYQ